MYINVTNEQARLLEMHNALYDTQLEADKQTVLSCVAALSRITVRVQLFKNDSQSWEAVGYSSIDPCKYIETLCYE